MQKKKKDKQKTPDYKYILPHTPIPLAKQYVSNTKCECGCKVRMYDTQKSELLCPICGLVYDNQYTDLNSHNLVYGTWSKSEPYSGRGYTRSEKEFMKWKHIKTRTYLGSKELRQMDYKFLIDVFKVNLCLSDVDVSNVWLIIRECKGIKNIHGKLNYERILLGVCRYVLYEKGVTGYLVNLNNQIYRDYKLKLKDYKIIEKNIKKYRSIYRCNT